MFSINDVADTTYGLSNEEGRSSDISQMPNREVRKPIEKSPADPNIARTTEEAPYDGTVDGNTPLPQLDNLSNIATIDIPAIDHMDNPSADYTSNDRPNCNRLDVVG